MMHRLVVPVAVSLCLLPFGASALQAQDESSGEPQKIRRILLGDDGNRVDVEDEWLDASGELPERFARLLSDVARGKGFIGVHMTELTPELRIHFGVPEEAGVMISKVVEGSPAEQAGVRVGDIVTRIDGEDVISGSVLGRKVRVKESHEVASLEIWRDGKRDEITVEIDEREPRRVFLSQDGDRGDFQVWGLDGFPRLKGNQRMPQLFLSPGDGEELGKALGSVREYFDGPEWKEKVRGFRSLDWTEIEARMKALEQRLEDLEEGSDGR